VEESGATGATGFADATLEVPFAAGASTVNATGLPGSQASRWPTMDSPAAGAPVSRSGAEAVAWKAHAPEANHGLGEFQFNIPAQAAEFLDLTTWQDNFFLGFFVGEKKAIAPEQRKEERR